MNEPAQKNISVEYYAILRELRGQAKEEYVTDAPTPRELYAHLRARFFFPLAPQVMRVAVNGAFASWDCPLNNRDCVAFIPPVAGG